MNATIIGQTCSGCKFCFEFNNGQGGIADICRAHPPTVLGGAVPQQTPNGVQVGFMSNTVWPVINKNSDWCGEYVTRLALS